MSESAALQVISRVAGLKKAYAGQNVLAIDELSIMNGETLALVGPSGSGKSTLLRILNFLEDPTSGQIEFMGRTCSNAGELPLALRRKVTTVFQRPVLLNRSIYDNVMLALRWQGKAADRGSVSSALSALGITHLSERRARTLSGGEAQRVALARAIVTQPALLLLDEPTANLDPYNVSLIESAIKKINRELGTTILLVTHNIFQAKRLADRVAFILQGKIIESGATEDFYNKPQDCRTRAFLRGDMVF